MNCGVRIAGLTLSAALLAGAAAEGAAAQRADQPPAGTQGELRARQEALFAAMLQTPDDLDLMFDHALVSIALRDYEAAITTLERMLIFNPALGRAKVELGAAYFRLGAYENARYYFDDVLKNDAPPPEVERRVNSFLAEIDARSQTSGLSGVATLGLAYSSNANLGTPDSDIVLGGVGGIIDDAFVESDDIGARGTLRARHFVDLGQPDGDVWLTDVSIFTLHYLDETRGDIDSLILRTGPRLSLDERAFGPKLRPFIEGELLASDNDFLYGGIGAGVEYSDTLSETVNVFGAASTRWREYDDRNDFDGFTHRVVLGAAYTPVSALTVTGSVYGEADFAEADFNSNLELGARLGALYRYDSGFDFTDRLWTASAYIGGAVRQFEDPDPAVDPSRERSDTDLRAGASHVFHIADGWFVQADADVLLRDSNLPNFDIDNLGVALSVGRSF